MTVCYDVRTLEAYLDGELASDVQQELAEHIKSCENCRSLLQQLDHDHAFAKDKMAVYLAALEVNPDKAWHNLEQMMLQKENKLSKLSNKKRVIFMLSKYRKAVAAGAAVAVLGFGLTFTPIQTFAANLLNIFRINHIQSVNVNPQDFTQIQKTLHNGVGKVTLGDMGQVEMSKTGKSGVVSLAEAQKTVDFKLLQPAKLPSGYSAAETHETAGGTINFTLNTEKTNAVLKDLGATTFLPNSLNNETFTAKIPNVVETTYQGAHPLVVAEARSPELTVPGDADVGAIRDALLALPFLPDNLRQQLSAIKDWQHTLIIPSLNGTSQNVTVSGAQGVYISSTKGVQGVGSKAQTALVWQKDSIVYGLLGNFSIEEGLNIANSMQ